MKKIWSFFIAGFATVTLSIVSLITLDLANVIDLIPDSRLQASFYNYDGSFLWSTYFEYGDTVVYKGKIPTKVEDETSKYTFASWDKSLVNLTKSTSFYPQFTKETRDYKCTFRNFNYIELFSEFVPRGGSATYLGSAPTRPSNEYYSYKFIGWDRPLENIQEDTTFFAQYEETPTEFEVKFLNYNGELLFTDYVGSGETAEYNGITPVKPSNSSFEYEFNGWDKDLNHIYEDTETTAVFKEVPVKFKVTFINHDGSVLYIDYVSSGGTAEYLGSTPYKEADGEYIYVFSGWNKALTNVTSNMVVSPLFTKTAKDYEVIFKNYDGTVLQTSYAKYKTAVKYHGETPTRPMDDKYVYNFIGWDRDIECVTSDFETYPVFEKELRKFKCTFLNFDSSFLSSEIVEWGKTVSYLGQTPYKPGDSVTSYRFVGWDKSLENIKQDTVFFAQFEIDNTGGGGGGQTNISAYSFKNYNGELLDKDITPLYGEVFYGGKLPTRPNDSEGRSFEFVGWDKEEWFESVPSTYFTTYAQYETSFGEFIVTYRDIEGNILFEDFVYPGQSSTYNGPDVDCISEEAGFIGWGNYIVYNVTLEATTYIPCDLDYITCSITVFPIYETYFPL